MMCECESVSAGSLFKRNSMKVTFLKGVAGNDFVYKKGVTYDLDAKQATEFIEAGFAEKVVEKQTATAKTKRTTRKKA